MCIILVNKNGVEIPSKEIFENMWSNNKDGGGFAYYGDDGKVHVEKGFMHFDSYYNRIKELDETIGLTNRSFVAHTRIETSGGVNRRCTHPFPISNKEEDLNKLVYSVDIAVAHNGIAYNNLPKKGSNLSDTQTFIKDYLYDIYMDNNKFYESTSLLFAIEKQLGSKLAIITNTDEVIIIGKFIEEEDGNMYSNETYLSIEELYKSWNTSYYYDSPSELDDIYDLRDMANKQLSLDEFLDVLDNIYTCEDGEVINIGNDTIIARDGLYGIDCCSNVFFIDYVGYGIEYVGSVYYDEINFSKAFGEDDLLSEEYPF